jgi:hypothetical protein
MSEETVREEILFWEKVSKRIGCARRVEFVDPGYCLFCGGQDARNGGDLTAFFYLGPELEKYVYGLCSSCMAHSYDYGNRDTTATIFIYWRTLVRRYHDGQDVAAEKT